MNEEAGSPCVHCGLCLDACPTYRLTGIEADSPRGRLYLMDAVRDERMKLDRDAAGHLDGCLGCVACETACPSGVAYGQRIAEFRPLLRAADPAWRRAARASVRRMLRAPGWQRAAVAAASAVDRVGLKGLRRRLPGLGLVSEQQAPVLPRGARRGGAHGAGKARARVALLAGCGARVFRPSLVAAATTALEENEITVAGVAEGFCCGALAEHEGVPDEARRLQLELARWVDEMKVDYVVTAAAGCRAALGDAARSTEVDRERPEAGARLVEKSREVCELLVELGFRAPGSATRRGGQIAYHDACHLLHAARVPGPPRTVLAATGAIVVDLGENAVCCGSAGTYNVVHAQTAQALGRRKGELIAAGGFREVAVANLGCVLQIERSLAIAGLLGAIRIAHPIEYLAEAYERERLPA